MGEPTNRLAETGAGWTEYARSRPVDAEAAFRQVLALNQQSADAWYGLAMSLRAQDRKEDAIQAFQQAVDLLTKLHIADNPTRVLMMRQLAQAHINQLTQGDWKLRDV